MGCSPQGFKELDTTAHTCTTYITQLIRAYYILPGREGNGTPLQYSCLENPMDEEPDRLQSMVSLRVGHD